MNKHSKYIMERFGISKEDFVKCVCLDYDKYNYNYMNGKFEIGGIYNCFFDGNSSYYLYDKDYYFLNRFSLEDFNINFRILSEFRQQRMDEVFKD
jgi:hypothetical protein